MFLVLAPPRLPPNDDSYDDEDAARKDWGGANVRFPDAVAAPAEY